MSRSARGRARGPAVPRSSLGAPLLLLIASSGLAAATPTVIRGPYLQMGTEDSGVVRWRTNSPTTSRVLYGPSGGPLALQATVAGETTEHVVPLTGLQSDTAYDYIIGTFDELLPASGSFVTAPAAGSGRPFRVWVIGDSGTGDQNAMAVRDAYAAFVADQPADLWIMLGDNAYADGTEAEYQTAVFETYPDQLADTWLWSAFGNHDSHSADAATQSGPYFDIFSLPTAGEAGGIASGTEAWYSFDWANVHFVCLDTSGSSLASDGPMLTWLAQDLAATEQRWIVAYFHHPPYSHGSHDSDDPADSGGRMFDLRDQALPLLEAAGVDLVLSGHSHSYERSHLLHGHYGTSDTLTPDMVLDPGDGSVNGDGPYRKEDHRGAVYTVAGSSGRVTSAPLDHPAMVTSLAVLGSVVLDFDGDRLDVIFLSDQSQIRDDFRLEKTDIFRDGFESGDTTPWS